MEKIVQTAGRNALGQFAPAFAHYNDDVLFGENWNDPGLDHKTRCLITVVALMSSGITDSSLQYHLENAKKAGVTRTEIAAVITHAAFYVGWPKGWAVFNMAKQVWTEEEAPADLSARRLCLLAVATSIDALAVGVSMAFMDVPVLASAAVIGVVAFGLSMAGGLAGRRLGALFQRRAELAGGLVLIAIGGKILFEHLTGG